MDKGLDIAERRCVLAFHAAAPHSPRKLATLARAFVRARLSDKSLRSTARSIESAARNAACTLDWARADRSLRWAEAAGRRIITIFDPDFPPALAAIPSPPLVLFVSGAADVLARAQVAVVGSRKGTHYGLTAAFEIAAELTRLGMAVTSGMAGGIDAAAHRGALHGGGPTVAVFGCGIDRIYPYRHRALADEIAAGGALISEFPLETPPRPYHFPRRNRLISGLSRGTLVVEAATRSGSISTAMHALEQGRDVFAVPGSIRSPYAAGCHMLIKQGATLVESAEDILALYSDFQRIDSAARPDDVPKPRHLISELERKLLDACGYDGATFDVVLQRVGLTATEVSSILSALEVRGLVRSLAGNAYLRTDD